MLAQNLPEDSMASLQIFWKSLSTADAQRSPTLRELMLHFSVLVSSRRDAMRPRTAGGLVPLVNVGPSEGGGQASGHVSKGLSMSGARQPSHLRTETTLP